MLGLLRPALPLGASWGARGFPRGVTLGLSGAILGSGAFLWEWSSASRSFCEGGDRSKKGLPLRMTATVVQGFGRGGKLLGCPTANMDMRQVGHLADSIDTGIYFGWAQVVEKAGKQGRGSSPPPPVYKAAISIGWNPQFGNDEKTVEPHLLHDFDDDFYGQDLRVMIVGFLRPEKAFDSMEALISQIQDDIRATNVALEKPEYQKLLEDSFWT